ncbi:MAG: DUF2079 domain-containing protein [Polyangiaceae bacterium]|nr:DUF2079 domain-containing protein [Polyangiaceae bacterium]
MSSERTLAEPQAPHGAPPSLARLGPSLAHLGQSLALLGISGASVGLLGAFLTASVPAPLFVQRNLAPVVTRSTMMVAAMGVASLFVLAALAGVAWRRERALAPVRRAADLLSPLSLAFVLPLLFDERIWQSEVLVYLVLLVAVGVGAELTFRRMFAALPEALAHPLTDPLAALPATTRAAVVRWAPLGVVVLAAAAYAAYFSHYTLLNHRRLQTSGFDLGIYDNLMFNAIHGRPFRATVLFGPDGGNNLASHAEFALIFFTPIYALRPGAETLLVFQSVILGFAAVPLYLFAKTQVPRLAAVVVALGYLMYAPLHGPNFYDFHWLPLAIFFHFWLYYGTATERWRLVAVMLPILYLIREDIAVGLALLGTVLLLSGARPKFGALLAVTSTAWFGIDKFVIMPWAGKWWFSDMYKDLIAEGERGYGSVVRTMVINPTYLLSTLLKEDKVKYVLHLFAPLVFLPARRPLLLFLACPGFFFTLLTTGYAPTLSIGFQYTTHSIPYVFGASVLALGVLSRMDGGTVRRRGALAAMSLVLLSHSFVFGAVLQHRTFVGGFGRVQFHMTAEETQRYQDLVALRALVPREASVSASENEIAHFSARKNAYTLRDHHGDADYIVVRRTNLAGNTRKNLEDALQRNPYGVLASRGEFYLFKKGHASPETAAAKAALGVR